MLINVQKLTNNANLMQKNWQIMLINVQKLAINANLMHKTSK